MFSAFTRSFSVLALGASLLSASLLSACESPLTSALPDPAAPVSQTTSNAILSQLTLDTGRDILAQVPGDQVTRLQTLIPDLEIKSLSQDAHLYQLRLPAGRSLLQSLQLLNQTPGVSFAESNPTFKIPDFKVQAVESFRPRDPRYGMQWNMRSAKIDQAWSLVRSNPNITVAVIDSGVDPNHEDLVDHLEPLEDIYNELKGSDVYNNPFSGEVINYGGRDGNGHGTHIAGIIAASMDNNLGVAGVVGGGVRILPIKATDYAGSTDAATLTAAFQRAIDRGAKVINISIGGPVAKSTRALESVIQVALQRNITIVSATGNESARDRGLISPITVPAAYNGVIAVGAHTEKDNVASYSNGGSQIDLVAPGGAGRSNVLQEGQQVWSTWPSYNTFEFFQKRVTSTLYAATSGTSMACPHVAGVVALMLAREPNLTPAQIRSRLIATADDMGTPGYDEDSGYGKLNAYRALQWTQHDAQDTP